jgi:hypothetical protein
MEDIVLSEKVPLDVIKARKREVFLSFLKFIYAAYINTLNRKYFKIYIARP